MLTSLLNALWLGVDFFQTYVGAVTAVASAVIAIFTVVLVVVTNKQARLTKIAAEAAQASANIATQTLRAMERTSERQLRAYVLVAGANMKLSKPDIPEAHISFKNSGQTPAYNVRVWINMWMEEHPLRVVLPSPPANFQMATSILPPGGHTYMVIPKNAPVPSQSVHLLGTPEGTIYVYGEVRYIDAFEIERWTKYRLIYGGREGARSHRMSHDTDGNEAI